MATLSASLGLSARQLKADLRSLLKVTAIQRHILEKLFDITHAILPKLQPEHSNRQSSSLENFIVSISVKWARR